MMNQKNRFSKRNALILMKHGTMHSQLLVHASLFTSFMPLNATLSEETAKFYQGQVSKLYEKEMKTFIESLFESVTIKKKLEENDFLFSDTATTMMMTTTTKNVFSTL